MPWESIIAAQLTFDTHFVIVSIFCVQPEIVLNNDFFIVSFRRRWNDSRYLCSIDPQVKSNGEWKTIESAWKRIVPVNLVDLMCGQCETLKILIRGLLLTELSSVKTGFFLLIDLVLHEPLECGDGSTLCCLAMCTHVRATCQIIEPHSKPIAKRSSENRIDMNGHA